MKTEQHSSEYLVDQKIKRGIKNYLKTNKNNTTYQILQDGVKTVMSESL